MPTLMTFRVNVAVGQRLDEVRVPSDCTAEVGTATTLATAPVEMTTLAVEPVKRPVADVGRATTTG